MFQQKGDVTLWPPHHAGRIRMFPHPEVNSDPLKASPT
jgi:hypothetical protein